MDSVYSTKAGYPRNTIVDDLNSKSCDALQERAGMNIGVCAIGPSSIEEKPLESQPLYVLEDKIVNGSNSDMKGDAALG